MSGSTRPRLRYGDTSLEIPESSFRIDPLPAVPSAPSGTSAVEAVLARPLGSPPFEEIVRGARTVLVVVSDATRSTGSALFLPALVDGIHRAGRASVTFIVASGIHRSPTDGEIDGILGPQLARRYPVLRHDPDDESRLVDLGRTGSGTVVRVNAALVEHDRIVVTGVAGFHYCAGFSGGRKALVPGLASRETVTGSHLRSITATGGRAPRAQAGRLDGNPMHRDITEGAALVGPHFLVNSVLGVAGGLERLFAGHFRRAHEAACRYLRATRVLRVEPRDLVVASAGGEPADIDLIQSHKTFENAAACLRPGGVVILVARCREGAGHPDFLPWFRLRSEGDLVRELKLHFQVYGQTALSWRRKTEKYHLILVSDLPAELARSLGAEPAGTLEEAFSLARGLVRAGSRGWLLEQGSRLLLESDAPS